jgi:hypothetical protein
MILRVKAVIKCQLGRDKQNWRLRRSFCLDLSPKSWENGQQKLQCLSCNEIRNFNTSSCTRGVTLKGGEILAETMTIFKILTSIINRFFRSTENQIPDHMKWTTHTLYNLIYRLSVQNDRRRRQPPLITLVKWLQRETQTKIVTIQC